MVEVGVDNVANNPNLTFIFFIGLTILGVLGLRFAFYAHRNRAASDVESQTPLWSYLLYIGLLGAFYAVAGLLEIVTSLEVPYKSGALIGMTLLLAFAIRRITTTASPDGGTGHSRAERLVRRVFVAVVLGHVVAVATEGLTPRTAAIEGLAAIAFASYGLVHYRAQATDSRLHGTTLDTLRRHLFPVMTFAALASVVNLAIPAGLDRVIVLHVQVVFLIMVATTLMTGTIKLRQNLSGL